MVERQCSNDDLFAARQGASQGALRSFGRCVADHPSEAV
jgi:hypothetical protein